MIRINAEHLVKFEQSQLGLPGLKEGAAQVRTHIVVVRIHREGANVGGDSVLCLAVIGEVVAQLFPDFCTSKYAAGDINADGKIDYITYQAFYRIPYGAEDFDEYTQ